MSGNANVTVRARKVSFRDIHIAPVTVNEKNTYTAGTPIKIGRAIKGKISDKFSSEKIFSDDGIEDISYNYEGTDVELEVNALAPQDKQALFGQLYENGFLVKTKNDRPPEVALGYRSKKLDGKYDFVWLYVGRFDQGFDDDYETAEDKLKTQTASLKGSFYAREKDDAYHISVDESNLKDVDTNARAAMAEWFAAVQEKPAAQA